VPVDTQVSDRPGLRLGDEQPGRANGGDLATRGEAGLQRRDEPVAEILAGPVAERCEHRRGHSGVGQQIAGRGGARGVDVRRIAQRPLTGVARRAARSVHDHELPERDVGGSPSDSRERVARRFLDKVFDGALDQFVLSILNAKEAPADATELKEIERLIAQARRQKPGRQPEGN